MFGWRTNANFIKYKGSSLPELFSFIFINFVFFAAIFRFSSFADICHFLMLKSTNNCFYYLLKKKSVTDSSKVL